MVDDHWYRTGRAIPKTRHYPGRNFRPFSSDKCSRSVCSHTDQDKRGIRSSNIAAGSCSNRQDSGSFEDSHIGRACRRRQDWTSLHNVAVLSVWGVCLLPRLRWCLRIGIGSVAQRRREIGIRMALGAQRKTVLRLITQGEMSAILLGGMLSLPFVLGTAPVYDRLLYGLQGIDFLSVTVAFVVLCSVSLMSSIVPTIRATEVPLSNLLVE